MPYYRKIWDLLAERRRAAVPGGLDGTSSRIIQEFLAGGVNVPHPVERRSRAGMDIVRLREYGTQLASGGRSISTSCAAAGRDHRSELE